MPSSSPPREIELGEIARSVITSRYVPRKLAGPGAHAVTNEDDVTPRGRLATNHLAGNVRHRSVRERAARLMTLPLPCQSKDVPEEKHASAFRTGPCGSG